MLGLKMTSIGSVTAKKQRFSFLQWYYNLPIRSKQVTRLYTSQIISVFGLVGISSVLIVTAGRTQLLNQAKAELAVSEINYNIKVNQMKFGFRGQSDNAAIVAAAISHTENKPLTPELQNQVKNILQNEIKARNIEYATLVGKDRRIIINANANRSGEIFDPNNLVSEVFKKSEQIQANSIVSWDELSKESAPLSAGFSKQDALIRYTVTPVKDTKGVVIGALISGDIVNNKLPIVAETLNAFVSGYSGIYLRKPTGEFALATALDQNDQDNSRPAINTSINDTTILKKAVENPGQVVTMRTSSPQQNTTYTTAAKALTNWQGEPIGVLVRGTTESSLNELLRNSLLLQLLIASLALLAEIMLVKLLGKTIAQPIKKLQQTTQQFAKGNRQVRAEALYKDELGELAETFNEMADSIIVSEEALAKQNQHQKATSERFMVLADFTSRIYKSLNSGTILSTSLTEISRVLQADRAEIYCLNEDQQNEVISAGVAEDFLNIIDKTSPDFLKTEEIESYQNGFASVFNNIEQANITNELLVFLSKLKVSASIIAPILQDGELVALLAIHQCDKTRNWQHEEINLVKQLAAQIGFALNQASLVKQLEIARQDAEIARQQAETVSEQIEQARLIAESNSLEQRRQKEALQQQVLELLNDIEATATGDLTVRAEVSESELGTVADFFNLLIENLRELVMQVKDASTQVNTSLEGDEWAVGQLSEQALRQALQINRTLDSVELMTQSIQVVAKNASQAATVARRAAMAASAGGKSIDSTVETIVNLQTTVVQTTDKVKLLGESSKKIAKVVSLVQQIGLQTNLLAINAGIEASRSAEGGEGFRVIAEQVGILASQSGNAIQEIEQVIGTIELGTKEVVDAMEEGTRQVIRSTRSVVGAKESLEEIFEVSRQIDELVASISSATVSQAHTSQAVSELMKQLAKSSQQTSDSSRQVSHSLRNTVEVAEQLQHSVGRFKIGTQIGTF
ncbi:MAG: methyl-accepting chemotaxis protein [Coleofasciculaceae cyanobacterium]